MDNDADLDALRELVRDGAGLPEVFYDSGYLIQMEGDGRLRSVGGGGKSAGSGEVAVRPAGPVLAEGA